MHRRVLIVRTSVASILTSLASTQAPLALGTPRLLDPGLPLPSPILCADLDRDGTDDLLVANGLAQSLGGTLAVLWLAPNGNVTARAAVAAAPADPALACIGVGAADFDGDGLLDVAIVDAGGNLALLPNAGPGRRRTAGHPLGAPRAIDALATRLGIAGPVTFNLPLFVAQDLDGDGHPDLVLAGRAAHLAAGPDRTGLRVWFGDAHGGLSAHAHAATAAVVAGGIADFDRDGVREILVLGRDATIDLFRAQNAGVAFVQRHVLAEPVLPTAMDLGDIDGDHLPDVVVAGAGGVIACLRGARDATLVPVSRIQAPGFAGAEIQALRIADVDGDRVADIVALQALGAAGNARLLVFTGLGGGAFALAANLDLGGTIALRFAADPPAPMPGALRAADLDLDGNLELFVGGVDAHAAGGMRVTAIGNGAPAWCAVERVGTGAPGGGGIRPRIGVAGGAPRQGNQDFALTLTDAPGAAACALLAGTTPLRAAVLDLELFLWPRFVTPARTSGSGPGAGFARVACPVPDDLAMVGVQCWFQWVVDDAGAARAVPITTSDGLRVVVGVAE